VRRDLARIFAAALVVRVVFTFLIYPSIAAQFGSGDGYDEIGLNLAQGRGYLLAGAPGAAERLPLYPLLLALSFALFGPLSWPWQLAQCVGGAVTCGVVYATARVYAGRRGALVAAVFCAVHPTLVLYSARPFTETLYVLLMLLFVRAVVRPRWSAMVVGGLLGLQLLTKTAAWLGLVACFPAARRAGLGGVARAALWVGVVVGPWVVWNLATAGTPHLVTTVTGPTLYHGLYISRHASWTTPAADLNRDAELALWQELAARGVARDADAPLRDQRARDLVRGWISDHPAGAACLWARNLVLTWYLGRSRLSMLIHFVLHAALLSAAAVGARRMWSRSSDARALALTALLLIGAYTAFHAVVQPAVRYILPVVPIAAVLAAAASPRER